MMTIEQVKKAEQLITERQRIACAKWDSVGSQEGALLKSWIKVDDQLSWAVEEFRKRKLDAIDAQLRELGVEPPQMTEPEPEEAESRPMRVEYESPHPARRS